MSVQDVLKLKTIGSEPADNSALKAPLALRGRYVGSDRVQDNSKANSLAYNHTSLSPADVVADERDKKIALSDLLAGQREVVIIHNGEDYVLRITSKNKLILTK